MRFGRSFLGLLIALLLSIWFPASAEPKIAALEQSASPAPPKDILLVLDNSGSMEKNDPKFLMREVVSSFANQLPPDSRLGLVLFDEKVRPVLGLTGADAPDFQQKVEAALKRIDYRGQRTDIPAGVEGGIYKLRQQGRPEAKRIIIFLTDGIVDLGSEARNLEQARWLRGSLAEQAKKAWHSDLRDRLHRGGRLPVDPVGRPNHGGEYYRVLAASDIPATFDQIRARMEAMTEADKPPVEPQAELVTEPSAAQAPSPASLEPSAAPAPAPEPTPESPGGRAPPSGARGW